VSFGNVIIWQPGETIEQLEERVVKAAVDLAGGNKETAAKALGVSPQTVYNHLKRYREKDKERAISRRAQDIVMADHTKVPDGNMPGTRGGDRGSFDGNGQFQKPKDS